MPPRVLYRGHAGNVTPLGWNSFPAAVKTNTCDPVSEVLVVVATTSRRPSPSRSAAARPRVSGAWPPLRVDDGQPALTRSAPARIS